MQQSPVRTFRIADSMEPTQSRKPKRRRHWLIVTLLLVLVSGVAWWEWPRGDARFVGKWDAGAGAIVELDSNGFGSFNMIVSGKPYWQPSRWFVNGDAFYFDTCGPKWNHQLSHLIEMLRGREKPTKFEIVSVERNELRLKQPGGLIQVWTRLP
ncbi:hypothetical protein AYO47_00240 [Planctomyces sp. SCGC AG-212-M04]|nr:hypothetical protein AYO47_00240 [Planctomyces sp. SCGC AG-212-M04]